MKTLQETLRKNAFDYRLIERTEVKAIYEQSDNGELIAYEIFKIKIVPECILGGNIIESHEKFPSDNDFGITAWTVGTNFESAMDKYNSL
jgi:hypothetical protein